jgi:hypothetical protein
MPGSAATAFTAKRPSLAKPAAVTVTVYVEPAANEEGTIALIWFWLEYKTGAV